VTFAVFLLLTVVSFLLTGLLHFLCFRWGWITARRLGKNRETRPPTSEGGLAFARGCLICLAASYPFLDSDLLLTPSEMRVRHVGLGFALIWVWAFGRWGDRKGFSHAWSLAAVTSGALLLAATGFLIHALSVGGTTQSLGWAAVPVTVLWLVILSEFVRLFEGLDGFLILLVSLGVFLQLVYVLPEEEGYARALCFCTLPPLLGLLPWRLYPARIELRGIGAFLPGFVFGAITVVGREKAFTTKAVVAPTLIVIAVFSLFCLWLLEQHLFLPKKKD
jgi:UDP-GlcNAc:undecaprenyl-phosphate GlcNAc-1-phosphate transferase